MWLRECCCCWPLPRKGQSISSCCVKSSSCQAFCPHLLLCQVTRLYLPFVGLGGHAIHPECVCVVCALSIDFAIPESGGGCVCAAVTKLNSEQQCGVWSSDNRYNCEDGQPGRQPSSQPASPVGLEYGAIVAFSWRMSAVVCR